MFGALSRYGGNEKIFKLKQAWLRFCHLSCFVVLSHFWKFKLDKIGSNWIKSDQIRSSRIKLVPIGSSWFKLDQKRSKWIRLIIWIKSDKTGSNQYFSRSRYLWFHIPKTNFPCQKIRSVNWRKSRAADADLKKKCANTRNTYKIYLPWISIIPIFEPKSPYYEIAVSALCELRITHLRWQLIIIASSLFS